MLRVILIPLVAMLGVSSSQAAITLLGDRATSLVRLRVGAVSSISEVAFDVPGGLVGSSTPVAGDSDIRIRLVLRYASSIGVNPDVSITADSTAGLFSGLNSIPVSEISWTSEDGDIPAGSFDGSATQPVYTADFSHRLRDNLNFTYLNTSVVPAGTYTGRVVYTVVAP